MENDIITDISSISGLFNVQKVVLILLGIAFLVVLSKIVNFIFDELNARLPSKRFLIAQLNTLFRFAIYLGGTFTLFIGVIDPPKEVVIATAGSLAVAIGFALKDLAASLFAGIVLLFDRPFLVGDRVAFDDIYGEIITIGLRSVKLKTLDDNLITIPNSRFINDAVASANSGELDMMVVCDFHVSYDTDIESAKNIIHEVIVTSRFAYLKKPVSYAVSEAQIGQTLGILISAKAYVMDVHFEKSFQSDVITRVNMLFHKNSIGRPILSQH